MDWERLADLMGAELQEGALVGLGPIQKYERCVSVLSSSLFASDAYTPRAKSLI